MKCGLSNKPVLTIIRGDDYLQVDARAITVHSHGDFVWPNNLTQARLVIWPVHHCANAQISDSPLLDINGVVFAASASTQMKVAFDLTRTQSLLLSAGIRQYHYEVKGLTINNSVTTLDRGFLTVLESEL